MQQITLVCCLGTQCAAAGPCAPH